MTETKKCTYGACPTCGLNEYHTNTSRGANNGKTLCGWCRDATLNDTWLQVNGVSHEVFRINRSDSKLWKTHQQLKAMHKLLVQEKE